MTSGSSYGTDQDGAGPLGDLGPDQLPRVPRPVVGYDLGAQGAGVLELDARRVAGHDDRGRDPQEPRRERDAWAWLPEEKATTADGRRAAIAL
jgi:hypothetical protein